jgi:aryl-alcohol dehydrogenase-like predicted oxidoreductase
LLDTAREYGQSEEKIGFFCENEHSEFYVSTKIMKIQPENNLIQDIEVSLSKSLNALRKDSIDLLSLHQSDAFIINNPNFWILIDELKNKNKIKKFGISIYDVEEFTQLDESMLSHIDDVQIPLNLIDRRFETIIDYMRSLGIQIIVRSIYLRGILAQKINDIKNYQIKSYCEDFFIKNPHLKQYSLKEIAFNYVHFNPKIDHIIVGVSSGNDLLEAVKFSESEAIDFNHVVWPDELPRDVYDPRKW